MTTDKLYKVYLKGVFGSVTGVKYHESYVIARTLDDAYKKVRSYLDDNDIGFNCSRELESIEVIAEDSEHTDVRVRLFK